MSPLWGGQPWPPYWNLQPALSSCPLPVLVCPPPPIPQTPIVSYIICLFLLFVGFLSARMQTLQGQVSLLGAYNSAWRRVRVHTQLLNGLVTLQTFLPIFIFSLRFLSFKFLMESSVAGWPHYPDLLVCIKNRGFSLRKEKIMVST